MKKSTMYRLIRREAAHRDEIYAKFRVGNHPDAEKVYNFHNRIVTDLAVDYLRLGGKRNVSGYLAADREAQ